MFCAIYKNRYVFEAPPQPNGMVSIFPGKAVEPGFSFSWSALCLVPLISSKGPADIDGKNSVVKMRVYFGSPQKKQAIYGGRASGPSKKRVKMQSQLMPARVLF